MDLKPLTFESDDEVDPEDITDDESEKDEVKKEIISPSFEFEDDEFGARSFKLKHGNITRPEKLNSKSPRDSDSVDEGDNDDEDNVRNMPHAEERANRVLEKIRSGADNADKFDTDQIGMDPETEAQFFDVVLDATSDVNQKSSGMTFSQLNLSRSILRAIDAAGYVTPTPIQSQVIPLALAGRDICASAATGSGKTAAFVLPFLERLLFRPKDTAEIRVLVVTPTRELATQIYEVLQQLAEFTDITYGLICGGKKDLKSQETLLRRRPDVVICTPGRIIDHLRNSQSVSIDALDVLILDEADRLLELGFQNELEELIRHCPRNRQTMLFSATMTSKVDELAILSLHKPVRVKVSGDGTALAPRLIQEFVKVRNEEDREPMILALVCKSGFNKRTIVFFETKQETHRMYLLLKLLEVPVSELHGDMTQPMRDLSLKQFRSGQTEVLLATDVAARGIDVQGIRTVINSEMPRTASTYIHRVGRTARAGSGGRSITLVSDGRRKVMREVLRGEGSKLSLDGGQVLSRTIPKVIIQNHAIKLVELEGSLEELMREEKLKLKLESTEREMERVQNLLQFEDEIKSRPARTWYQSVDQKKELQQELRNKVNEEQERLATSSETTGRTMTLAEKALRAARRDDYRAEDGKESKKQDHRLSRKKRRRMEAMRADEGDGEDGADGGEPEPSLTAISKRAKNATREKEKNLKEKMLNISGIKKIKTDNGGSKVVRQTFAVGGFDHDLNEWSSSGGLGKKMSRKKQRLAAANEKEFKEFDPNKKLRKGGKPGKASFKSKTKFKRRK